MTLSGGIRSGLLWAALIWQAAAADVSVDHFSVLLYHHVSADTPAASSVTPETFERHLTWLEDNDYQVWALDRALAALDSGRGLPDRVVALTFDDAYQSVIEHAAPRLAARDWPFTVFVNTDAIDAGHRPYMSWDQLRRLGDFGAAIGNHGAAHLHAGRMLQGESEADWRARVLADIDRAHRRIEAEIGQPPMLFAWPYGEDVPELYSALSKRYRHALAQRSGAVGPHAPALALPRFPLATGFDSLDRLRRAAQARPVPVIEAETEPARVRGMVRGPNRLVIRIAPDSDFQASSLNCFSADGTPLARSLAGEDSGLLHVRLPPDPRPGRNKVNCTAPAADGSGAYHWYSFQWLSPPDDGEWPD